MPADSHQVPSQSTEFDAGAACRVHVQLGTQDPKLRDARREDLDWRFLELGL
jgi:hypothetical protein